jgi:histidinol-phosphate phosphatase family protein
MRGLTALILVGGLGTRLRPAVADLPKALAPVAGRPFVGYLIDRLARWGLGRVILCTGYMADAVEEVLGDRYAGVDIEYSREPSALGTAGAVRHALPLVTTDAALVLNGDSFCELDLDVMANHHQAHRALATLLVTRSPDGRAFGSVDLDEGGQVLRFREKVEGQAPFINAGVYLLAREVIESVEPGRPSSFESDVFPGLVGRGLFGFVGRGPLLDIGTPDTYRQAELFMRSRGLLPRRWVLLDRDGTILVYREHLKDPNAVELIPGAPQALRALRELGLGIAVVTNQSVIGRGWIDQEGLSRIHQRMMDRLESEGARLDAILVCPHRPDEGCACRKPETGLVTRLARDFPIFPPASFVVGDDAKDIELGRRIGATTVLVRTGLGRVTEAEATRAPDIVANDLLEASGAIARSVQESRVDGGLGSGDAAGAAFERVE